MSMKFLLKDAVRKKCKKTIWSSQTKTAVGHNQLWFVKKYGRSHLNHSLFSCKQLFCPVSDFFEFFFVQVHS